VGAVSKLAIVYNSTTLSVIDTGTWTVESMIQVGSSSGGPIVSSIFYSGNQSVTAFGDSNGNSVIVELQSNRTVIINNKNPFTAALVQPGVIATTGNDAVVRYWNLTSGVSLGNATENVPFGGTFIVPLNIAVNGFAISKTYSDSIVIYSSQS